MREIRAREGGFLESIKKRNRYARIVGLIIDGPQLGIVRAGHLQGNALSIARYTR